MAWKYCIPHLIFDDKEGIKNLGNLFKIDYDKFTECLIFLNLEVLLQKQSVYL